jgi:hypothetical protein
MLYYWIRSTDFSGFKIRPYLDDSSMLLTWSSEVALTADHHEGLHFRLRASRLINVGSF